VAAIVEALLPIFGLIVVGFVARRSGWLPPAFWTQVERLVYYLLFPALLLRTVAGTDFAGLPLEGAFAALALAVIAVAALVLLARPLLTRVAGLDGPGFTSVFQGAIRLNTYIGLAAAAGIFGPDGLALAAIGIAAVVPVVNVASVVVLARYGGGQLGILAVVGQVVRNPIILAVAAGGALNALGIPLPFGVDPFVEILGRASLPLALLAVGAGLSLKAARNAGTGVAIASILKLGAAPALTLALCQAFGVTGLAVPVAVLFNAVPGSASSYILARQMGGDHAMLAGVLTCETALAFVTMPLWLLLLA